MENQGSIFTSVMKKRQKRSNFNLSHDVKLSTDMARLTPIFVSECVPGDKFNIQSTAFLRMAPLISPVMHKIKVHIEYFFVPNRILWKNWETFITGSRNGKPLPADEMPAFPTVHPWDETTFLTGPSSLMDYMGLPVQENFPEGDEINPNYTVSALPFAAYQRIYDEYYRDQNLIESVYDVVGEGPTGWDDYNMLQDGLQPGEVQQQLSGRRVRCWEHDYFTSALPWAQKGEEVTIPFESALATHVTINGVSTPIGPNQHETQMWANPDAPSDGANLTWNSFPSGTDSGLMKTAGGTGFGLISTAQGNAATINDLRAAIKLQEWLETNARGGSRYFESIFAHFGVKSPDSRLQRPEFIGSSRSTMTISEVLQTSSPQSENDTPQGNMSGHGQSLSGSKNFNYYCQEHGHIIGIMSIMPKTAYQQGIPKFFMKTNDRLEYYFPEFAHLGEQEVQDLEIYAGTDVLDQRTFGYVPRYSEYKFINSRVAGDFRDTLNFWHLGRIFGDKPVLNDQFVAADPSKRIFAVQDLPASEQPPDQPLKFYDSIYGHVFHDVKANRLMPKYGTPTL